MKKPYSYRRVPFNYDGPRVTTRTLDNLLSHVLQTIGERYKSDDLLVLQAWPHVVGSAISPYVKAKGFVDGVVHVSVQNATVLSLMHMDKQRLLASLQKMVPGVIVRSLSFRIG